MARPRKDYKRVSLKMASDAADLLEQYCKINRFDTTFAIESLIRLHVPMLLERKKMAAKRSS